MRVFYFINAVLLNRFMFVLEIAKSNSVLSKRLKNVRVFSLFFNLECESIEIVKNDI